MKTIPYSNTYGVNLYNKQTPEELLANELGKPYIDYRKKWFEANNFELRTNFPIHLDIETNYSCNLKCIMCPYGDAYFQHPEYKGKSLNKEVIKDVIFKGVKKGLKSIRFSGLNEPLLYKDLIEVIGYAKQKGILDIFLTSNGMLLDEDISVKLIESGLTHLMISLDASTQSTYSRIRVGGNFEKVIKNINSFIDIRNELNSFLPLLRISFTKMSLNIHEVDAFVEHWQDKADYIAIVGYLNNICNKSTHRKLTLDQGLNKNIKNYKCSQPWVRCTIFTNGDVFPCCMNYGRYDPVGNIFKNDLFDIWNSDSVKYIQNINKKGEYYKHKVCLKCISKRDIFSK